MARTTSSRSKIVRKFGENIFGQAKFDKILAKKPHPPGAHGKKMRRRTSDYGLQLKEKQKLKAIYDIGEKQFKNYYQVARKEKAATGSKLLQILESRLDNLVFRSGFAPTRAAARQLVSHGHVLLDNKRVDVPSYQVSPDQIITLKAKTQKIAWVAELLGNKEINIPKWISRKAVVAKLDRLPKRDEIDINIQEQLIVEFYSR